MDKSEVYSWRIAPDIRRALEEEARREGKSMAKLLDEIAASWLEDQAARYAADDGQQERLHAAALKTLGKIAESDPHRAERARATIRRRLREQHGR